MNRPSWGGTSIYDVLDGFRQNFRGSPGRLDAKMLCAASRAIPVSQVPILTRARASSEGRLRATTSPAMKPGKRARGGESSIRFRSPPFLLLIAGREFTGFGRSITSYKRGGLLDPHTKTNLSQPTIISHNPFRWDAAVTWNTKPFPLFLMY